jgi:hypothetical protein
MSPSSILPLHMGCSSVLVVTVAILVFDSPPSNINGNLDTTAKLG